MTLIAKENLLNLKMIQPEWLETDGRGGYSYSTANLIPTRKYHSLVVKADQESTERINLINAIEVFFQYDQKIIPLSSFNYAADTIYPLGYLHLQSFESSPWPSWKYQYENIEIIQELFIEHTSGATVISWTVSPVEKPWTISVRPLIANRSYHNLNTNDQNLNFAGKTNGGTIDFSTNNLSLIRIINNASYSNSPLVYKNFSYQEELNRGYSAIENLSSPGIFNFNSGKNPFLIFDTYNVLKEHYTADECFLKLRNKEKTRREIFQSKIEQSAEQFLVKFGKRDSIIAGYPWFTDWGRDNFISIRGILLAGNKFDLAKNILLSWKKTISEGMIPNRFPDNAEQPEYNSVDASLWYVISIFEFLNLAMEKHYPFSKQEKDSLLEATIKILSRYQTGTRYGIKADSDGLIRCGIEGSQLTWMDAKFGNFAVTPRIGKPVEIQALWLNALRLSKIYYSKFKAIEKIASKSFQNKFWNQELSCLYDVIDCNHKPGEVDSSIRPNQIFAIGGLPYSLVSKEKALLILNIVEEHLLTPFGLRTLSSEDPQYRGSYWGDQRERDLSYHQGTVWPWLLGAFIEAWIRVRGESITIKKEAESKFLAPLLDSLNNYGVDHIAEIFDGNFPHHPRGCPFQAWSIAELMRIKILLSSQPKSFYYRMLRKLLPFLFS